MKERIIKTMEITSYLVSEDVSEDRSLIEVNEKVKMYLPYFYEYIKKLKSHLLELQLRVYQLRVYHDRKEFDNIKSGDIRLLENVKLIRKNIKFLSGILNNIEAELECLLLKIEINGPIDGSLFHLLNTMQDSMTDILENKDLLDLEVLIDYVNKNRRFDILLTETSRYIKAIKGFVEFNKELNIKMITLTTETEIIQIEKFNQLEHSRNDVITYTLYYYPDGLEEDFTYSESFENLPLAIDKGNKILIIKH